MTDLERRELKPGQKVVVRDDAGHEAVWEVRSSPWQLGHGEWVVGLRGKSGGYLLSRVVRLSIPWSSHS